MFQNATTLTQSTRGTVGLFLWSWWSPYDSVMTAFHSGGWEQTSFSWVWLQLPSHTLWAQKIPVEVLISVWNVVVIVRCCKAAGCVKCSLELFWLWLHSIVIFILVFGSGENKSSIPLSGVVFRLKLGSKLLVDQWFKLCHPHCH